MNKTWLITGTSAGLGRVMTEKLLQRNDRVIATVRQGGALDALKLHYGDALQIITLDLTRSDTIRAGVAQAFALAEKIDVVVSNAGYGLFGAAEEVADDQIAQQIATNLTGSIQLIRAVLPWLRKQGGGRIVQVSSEGGRIAYPCFSLYHATKWGIEGFVTAVAQEVADLGIDFILAEPGPTGTRFAQSLVMAPALAAYENTAAGRLRAALSSGEFAIKGDAGKTVDAIIAATDMPQPPFRLALGSTAFNNIRQSLQHQLAELETQEAIAAGADAG
ncbi:putative short chain dehydrogenase [Sodalis praecaptivus]|uniref:Putative short chain dehydrogenase n=1 Tax=Sodalis praecaptivus TaxID=1239307 RepID=W0HXS0_9GAMM|nr:SDR family oxidoreductase [Sodalis praecaptivus]AHF76995.1 putative short chain dehydrogenase [Sodalis praecaptivus]